MSRAALTTEANASLRRLAMEIGGRNVEVVGYTDSQGAAAANQALSLRRAEAVAAILKESGASGSIRTDGRGAADPQVRAVAELLTRPGTLHPQWSKAPATHKKTLQTTSPTKHTRHKGPTTPEHTGNKKLERERQPGKFC